MIPDGDEEEPIEADSEQSRTEVPTDRQQDCEEREVSWHHPVAQQFSQLLNNSQQGLTEWQPGATVSPATA